MSTLKDVARLAGVSITTASHALNNTRTVSDELRRRVLKAKEDLDYRPNLLAQSLRKKETRTIGLLVPYLASEANSSFYVRLSQGVCSMLDREEYFMLLSDNSGGMEDELRQLQRFCAHQVDGLVVAPVGNRLDHSYIAQVVEGRFPIVLVDQAQHNIECDAVIINSAAAYDDITEQLVAAGHRRIGLLTASLKKGSAYWERYQGYLKAMRRHGLDKDVRPLIGESDHITVEAGRQVMSALLERNADMTALIMTSNMMGMGAVEVLTERDVRFPQDLALVGIDDYAWSHYTSPPLTVLDQPSYEMGRKSAEILIERIGNPKLPHSTYALDMKMIRRGSF